MLTLGDKYIQVNLSRSSGVGAISTALLPWQLTKVGSAPWLSNKEQTSTRFLEAASWSGVNCQRSIALTQAPCWIEKKKSYRSVIISLDQIKLVYLTVNFSYNSEMSTIVLISLISAFKKQFKISWIIKKF